MYAGLHRFQRLQFQAASRTATGNGRNADDSFQRSRTKASWDKSGADGFACDRAASVIEIK
jgi:hypothetical protein